MTKDKHSFAVDSYPVAGGLGHILIAGGVTFIQIMHIRVSQLETKLVTRLQAAEVYNRTGRIKYDLHANQVLYRIRQNVTPVNHIQRLEKLCRAG